MYTLSTLRRASCLLFLACAALFIAPPKAAAQAGQLDPTFGQGGIVTTDFGLGFVNDLAAAFAVAIQPDGKIVVCGSSPTAIGAPLATLARYNTNGSLDTSFGTNGIVTTSNVALPSAIVLQTNGDIVVAGSIVFRGSSETMNVLRYSASGILDSTFGTGGIVTLSNDQGAASSALALQPNGDILYANGSVLFRLLPNGQLDASFGSGGKTALAGKGVVALGLFSNGKILVAGTLSGSGTIGRYSSNGALDATYGINGQLGTTGSANEMLLLANGQLLVAGNLASGVLGPTLGFAVTQYVAAGVTNPKFGTHGGVVTPVPGSPTVQTTGLGVELSGDIVTLGTGSANFANYVFALARYTSTGQLDNTFGTDGIVTTAFAGKSTVTSYGLAIQSDGKIVAVGSYSVQEGVNSTDYGFLLARYLGQ